MTGMNKIMRLSKANIRRHKTESLLLCILIMLCMALMSGAFSAEKNIKRMFPDMAERTGFLQNQLSLNEKQYDERMVTLLREDERVTEICITAEGDALKEKCKDIPEKVSSVINELEPEEARELYTLLHKIIG